MKFSIAAVALSGFVLVNADCISDCTATAAEDLGCDSTDLSGCYCVSTFATKAKACLYETSDCGSSYVSEFYTTYDATCADVTTGTTTSAAAASVASETATSAAASEPSGTITSAAASESSSGSCSIDSCLSTAASELGCDVTDIAGCVCLSDFATKGKACLYNGGCSSDVSSFYEQINSQCADVSASTSATAAATSAAAAASSAAAVAASATTAGSFTTSATKTAVGTGSSVANTTGSGAVVTAGANANAAYGAAVLALGAGVAALL